MELIDNELIAAESQYLDDDYDPDGVSSLKFVVTAAGRRFVAEAAAKA